MIATNMHFETILGLAIGNAHNTGIIDEDIQSIVLFLKGLHKLANALQGSQIHGRDKDSAHFLGGRLSFFGISTGQDDGRL